MPETGFTGSASELNRTTGSYPGSVRTRFSNRKPQTHAYAPLSPVLHFNPGQGDLVGGNLWDMRATGRRLGNPAAEQAQGPPTGEMRQLNRDGGPGEDPLFTDFTASSIGTPANLLLPYYAARRLRLHRQTRGISICRSRRSWLSQHVPTAQPASSVDTRWVPLVPANQGRFQVPTLRNVDKRPYPSFVKAYGHNGYFKSIKSIVHFYNTRDVLPRCSGNDHGEGVTCWPAPESTANMNTKFVGRLGLSDEEENALVSFMQTLTDGFMQR